ncbi:DUF6220 domain-containing protein [Virgibacillus oceani]|uniref:Uncharacterized protein n=1 Tax=Virgibacillus oceani TaxID=1479511 RepID=A0A917HK16_9BACI|nr:DUF6220 domain-containing protein [Virgibacillus oceani]GGG80689.1 hypothetical protein GCM10011398_27640 [Virgibacillus oceani]
MGRFTKIGVGRTIYLLLAILFTCSVVLQFFLAGAATFVSPLNWMRHTTFIHLFGFNIPIFMLLFAFIGGLPRWAYWQVFGLLVLIFSMYFTANMIADFPWIGAVHPVIAALLFFQSCVMVSQSWKFIFNKGEGEN